MPGVLKSDGNDELSVGNAAGNENSMSLLRAIKATSNAAQAHNQANTSFNTLRNFIRKYAVLDSTVTGSGTEVAFGDFTNTTIFGVTVQAWNETPRTVNGFNYDDRGNGRIEMIGVNGGRARGGNFSFAVAGAAIPAERARFDSSIAGSDDDGNAITIPASERFAIQAVTAGSSMNGVTLSGSDSIRPFFSGAAAINRSISVANPTGADITVNGNNTSTLNALATSLGFTVSSGGTRVISSNTSFTIPTGGSFSGSVGCIETINVATWTNDPGDNADWSITGDGSKTIGTLASDAGRTLSDGAPGSAEAENDTLLSNWASIGDNALVLASGASITFSGGSDGVTLQQLVAQWNALNPTQQVQVAGHSSGSSANPNYAPGITARLELNGGSDGSGAAQTTSGTASFGSLGGTARFTSTFSRNYQVTDNTSNKTFSFTVNLNTRAANNARSITSDGNSFNDAAGGQVTIGLGNVSTGGSAPTVTLLCKPIATGDFEIG